MVAGPAVKRPFRVIINGFICLMRANVGEWLIMEGGKMRSHVFPLPFMVVGFGDGTQNCS